VAGRRGLVPPTFTHIQTSALDEALLRRHLEAVLFLRYMTLLRFSMYHIWDAIFFFLSRCWNCELKQGVSGVSYCIFIASHGNTFFRFNRKDDAQKIPPRFKPGFMGRYGMVWVRDTEKKTRRWESFFFFFSFPFVIDTSQLHYSLGCV
jgi:hypothetical protein